MIPCDQGAWTACRTFHSPARFLFLLPHYVIWIRDQTERIPNRKNNSLARGDCHLASEKVTSFSPWYMVCSSTIHPVSYVCSKCKNINPVQVTQGTILVYKPSTHFERKALKRRLRPLNPEWRKLPAQSIL